MDATDDLVVVRSALSELGDQVLLGKPLQVGTCKDTQGVHFFCRDLPDTVKPAHL